MVSVKSTTGADLRPAPVADSERSGSIELHRTRSRLLGQLLSHDDHKMSAAVLRSTLSGIVIGDRPVLAVGHRAYPGRSDAAAHEVITRRAGPTLAERDVVLLRSDAVGVALDRHLDVR